MNLLDVVPVRMAMAWGSHGFWCFSVRCVVRWFCVLEDFLYCYRFLFPMMFKFDDSTS